MSKLTFTEKQKLEECIKGFFERNNIKGSLEVEISCYGVDEIDEQEELGVALDKIDRLESDIRKLQQKLKKIKSFLKNNKFIKDRIKDNKETIFYIEENFLSNHHLERIKEIKEEIKELEKIQKGGDEDE